MLAELGLKNVLELPLAKTIQATMPLGSLAGQVPAHVGSSVIWGGLQGAVVGQVSTFELHCLDPGGGVFNWWHQSSFQNICTMALQTVETVWLTGPFACNPMQMNNNPSVSRFSRGTNAVIHTAADPEIQLPMPSSNYAPMYIPKGSFLTISPASTTAAMRFVMSYTGITATEGGE